MHWLLWLSLTEAEPSNVSRQKHLTCLLYRHMLLQTRRLYFKTWTKPTDKQDFITVIVTATNHTSDCVNSVWSFDDVQVQGEAVLPEPCCQAHLCFYAKAGSEEGARAPSASMMAPMGARALDWPWEPPPHGCKTSQPLAAAGGTAFPTLAWQHLQDISHCQDRHLQHGELGCKLRPGDRSWGAWFEERDGQTGTRDKQHRDPFTLGTRQKLGGPSVQNYLTYFSKYSVKHSPSVYLNVQRRWVPLPHFKARETQAPRLRATCPRPLWKY